MPKARLSRRRFLGYAGAATAAASLPVLVGPSVAGAAAAAGPSGLAPGTAPGLARGYALDATRDERYWESVQQAFNVDRSLIHLNNGGVCPAPTFVQDAERAHHLDANRRPFYAHQSEVSPQIESVRRGLANLFGCDSEEIALTRNTSEGMEIVQLGLQLERGDEILTTEHDYPRMMQTWDQRAARDGVVVRTVPVPVPLVDPAELVRRLERGITSRTKLVMCCHMVDLTGQVLPVRAIADMAHKYGVPVLVDGAQTFGQFHFTQADLDCDFFATSLHKWMMGPQGTGMLYVQRKRIPDVWPLMPAAAGLESDIRKFEDVGTQPPARFLALGETLAFHRTLGAQRKGMRLRYLRDYALQPLLQHDRVTLRTELETAYALATIDVDGVAPAALRNYLWNEHRIRVRPIDESGVCGIRISPALYTTLPELDRFLAVMDSVIRDGLPD